MPFIVAHQSVASQQTEYGVVDRVQTRTLEVRDVIPDDDRIRHPNHIQLDDGPGEDPHRPKSDLI
jgi:hypothetical protein